MWHRLDTALIRIDTVLAGLDAMHAYRWVMELATFWLFLSMLDRRFEAMDKSMEEIKRLISIFDNL